MRNHKTRIMDGSAVEEFDVIQFEKKLTNLKDTQESIQTVSSWCLQNRQHHKKIVTSWLNVLKQVKIEHRLTLFYLANDVIQYSKRKNYEFVESWGTSLQRATTMVRDEKIKHKIVRIFNIWEQRTIFNEEFIADLNGLLRVTTLKKTQAKDADSDDFQPTTLVANIRDCMKLETETDANIKNYTKSQTSDLDNIRLTVKDREQVEEVEQEISDRKHKLELVIRCLNEEIKARGLLITAIEQADTFYTTQRGEVKVVANAYRNFGNRIKNMKKKLEELQTTLPSPIPSPDINAPSPEPDNDFILPDENDYFAHQSNMMGYMGNNKLPFNISDFNSESPKPDSGQKIQVISSGTPLKDDSNFNLNSFFKSYMQDSYSPGTPLPVPPVGGYNHPQQSPFQQSPQTYPLTPMDNIPFNPPPRHATDYIPSEIPLLAPLLPPPMPPALSHNESYDPMNWMDDGNSSWDPTDFVDLTETPISPPHFEREGIDTDLVEYIEGDNSLIGADLDIDHRQLAIPKMEHSAPLNISKGRAVDIDHRNLISLTGSPITKIMDDPLLPPPAAPPILWSGGDMDFRQQMHLPPLPQHNNMGDMDIDYRNKPPSSLKPPLKLLSQSSNLITLNPPPPPPPLPPSQQSKLTPPKTNIATSPNLITIPTTPTTTTVKPDPPPVEAVVSSPLSTPPPPPPLKPSLLDEMDEFLKNTSDLPAPEDKSNKISKSKGISPVKNQNGLDIVESIDMDIVSDEDNDDIYNFTEEELKAEDDTSATNNDDSLKAAATTATDISTTTATVSSPMSSSTPTPSAVTNPFNNLNLQQLSNPQQTLQEQIQQISQQIQQHFNHSPMMPRGGQMPPRMPLLSTPNMKFPGLFPPGGSPFIGSPEIGAGGGGNGPLQKSWQNNNSLNENCNQQGGERADTPTGVMRRSPFAPPSGGQFGGSDGNPGGIPFPGPFPGPGNSIQFGNNNSGGGGNNSGPFMAGTNSGPINNGPGSFGAGPGQFGGGGGPGNNQGNPGGPYTGGPRGPGQFGGNSNNSFPGAGGPGNNAFGGGRFSGGPMSFSGGPGNNGPFQQQQQNRQFSPQMHNNFGPNNNNNFRGNGGRGNPYFRGGRGGGGPGGMGPNGPPGMMNNNRGGGRGHFRGNKRGGGMW